MAAYPTEDGKTLAKIIRSFMIQSTAQAEINLSNIPFYDCFLNSKEIEINARIPNLLAQYALGKGIDVYVNTYGSLALSHAGTVAPGAYTMTTIAETDKFSPGGKPVLPPLSVWMAYAMPSMFGAFNEIDYIEGIDSLFKRLGMWLATPSPLLTCGVFKNVTINGIGIISWNGWSGSIGDDIKDKIKSSLEEYYASNPTDPIEMFETSWDMIASGIVEMLSYNSISTLDIGFALVNSVAPPAPMSVPYSGASLGKVEFTQGQNAVIKFGVPIPILGEICIQYVLNLPQIPVPCISIKDANCQNRKICLDLNMGEIGLTTFVSDFTDIFIGLIDDFILSLLSVCYTIDETIELTGEFYKQVLDVTIPGFNAGLSASWAEQIEDLTNQLIMMIWSAIVAPVWNILMTAVAAAGASIGIVGADKLVNLYKQIQAMIESINKVTGSITELIDGITIQIESIQEVIDLINSIDWSIYINICKEFVLPPLPVVPPMPAFPPLSIPPLPPLPNIPGIPEWSPFDLSIPPPDLATGLISAVLDPILALLVLPPIEIDIDIEARVHAVIDTNGILPCHKSCK